jgi:Uri superfamily endonuclease
VIPPSDSPGTYALILESAGYARVPVGRHGPLDLPPGVYAYVGSALGPGGLRARIARHLDPARPRHWHIDYLKRATRVVEVWYVVDPVRREHAWARAFGGISSASIPMPRFGSSDCTCPAHLFHFPTRPGLATFRRALGRTRGAGSRRIGVIHPPWRDLPLSERESRRAHRH